MHYNEGVPSDCIIGDVREVLPILPEKSVQMCVTSPPYWRLRDYGVDMARRRLLGFCWG